MKRAKPDSGFGFGGSSAVAQVPQIAKAKAVSAMETCAQNAALRPRCLNVISVQEGTVGYLLVCCATENVFRDILSLARGDMTLEGVKSAMQRLSIMRDELAFDRVARKADNPQQNPDAVKITALSFLGMTPAPHPAIMRLFVAICECIQENVLEYCANGGKNAPQLIKCALDTYSWFFAACENRILVKPQAAIGTPSPMSLLFGNIAQ